MKKIIKGEDLGLEVGTEWEMFQEDPRRLVSIDGHDVCYFKKLPKKSEFQKWAEDLSERSPWVVDGRPIGSMENQEKTKHAFRHGLRIGLQKAVVIVRKCGFSYLAEEIEAFLGQS